MADVKISDLTDGSPIQAGDLVEIERPGSPNVSRKAELGAAAGLSVGTTAGTVAAGNHTHADATTSVSGFMSASDKTKLDGIEAGADVTDATNVAAAGAIMDGDFTTNGLMARTGSGSYASRTITAGAGISVSNGSGASGNPTVAVDHSDSGRLVTITDTSNPSFDAQSGRTQVARLTATANRTIQAPSNPADGQKLIIEHTASGGARTIGFATGTGAFDLRGKTIDATASGTTDYFGFVYNASAQRWRLIAIDKPE